MNKEEILDQAKSLISGDRIKEYGPPIENFTRIAKMWSIILGIEITASQVAQCMIGLKMTRLIQTEKHADSWVDLAGYAATGGECALYGDK